MGKLNNNMQTCKNCLKKLSKTKFYKNRLICVQCKLKQNDDYRKRTEYNKNFYIKNKDKEKQRCLKYYYDTKDNPEVKLRNRKNQLKQKYNMTLDDYNKILNKQKGLCAICRKPREGGRGALHVDHDHKSGNIRGLLCHYCNTALGQFNDSLRILKNAYNYIKRNRK